MMSIGDAECRRKWQHLCNNNNKLANSYYNANSGESARGTPNWVHWTAMEFVRQNRASYRTSTELNLVGFPLLSNSIKMSEFYCIFLYVIQNRLVRSLGSFRQSKFAGGETAQQRKRAKSVNRPARTVESTSMSTATGEALERLDVIMETIGAGKTNPHLAASKEWAVVLNQMSPMYAARAKSEIKTMLSKYWSLSVAAEEEAAENQYRSELAKTNKCIVKDFIDQGVSNPCLFWATIWKIRSQPSHQDRRVQCQRRVAV
ncbi:uncharacterized protein LOC129718264 [Wyeomyia smithii]|uniref:uncharacterized protein LOC129718264 n=1 Tax=Wyeomyia smithii TaxID=174621 RepID=UPI00246805D3|nr:uncharacterized protein LOC129718264 [Wyeomyia smithii]XP_055524841.1 uncharacterized protein LOC129718264 [Wyeomyia smithii]XP_055524842.1 uncharacterized protein LOC129718264 [Wyeomyia smithii]